MLCADLACPRPLKYVTAHLSMAKGAPWGRHTFEASERRERRKRRKEKKKQNQESTAVRAEGLA